MEKKGKRSFLLARAVLAAGCLLLVGVGPGMGAAEKPQAPKKASPVPAPVQRPEIRRVAAYQSEGGEPLLRSPLALVRDDHNGDLIITSFAAGEAVILDKRGLLVNRIGTQAGLVSPHGVAMDGQGRIYLSEVRTGRLKVFNPAGILVDEIDLARVMGRPVAPGRIALGPDGRLYLADLKNNEILIFDSRLEPVRSLGGFSYLQKAGVLPDGRIIGLAAQGTAVRIFDREGKPLLSFGEHGVESDRTFSFPTGFAVDGKGRLWIADAFQHRLKVFSLDGTFLFNFGRIDEKGSDFLFPVDLCFGEKGELFVLEKGANRVQVFQVEDLKD